MDEYRIDSHKLIYHPQRVAAWLRDEDIYPLYIEVSPFGACNHRCIFCALDYLEYRPNILETQTLKSFLKEISAKGVKSIMFAGEGEPLLHKDIAELIISAKDCGLDAAITTNGVLFSQETLEQVLAKLSWLRISLNAGRAETYSAIHRTSAGDFSKVTGNIKAAVQIKRKQGYATTLGVQFLLLNENYTEATVLAEILKDIGADYLIVKPYSQHPASINRLKGHLDYDKLLFLEEKLDKYSSRDFKVIFRRQTALKIKEQRPYKKCLGLSFWAYLTAWGDLYACSAFLGDERLCCGNVYKESFEQIWKGQRRRAIMKMMQESWDIDNCREVCRLDEVNRYLWELRQPPQHVNFI